MATNTANIRVTANEQEVDQLSRSVDRLGDELQRTDRVAEHFTDSVKGLALSFVTIEAAIRVAQVAVTGLKASFDAFAETNAELSRQQEILEERINRSSQSFGRSVFGNGRGVALLQAFGNAVRELSDDQGVLVESTISAIEATTTFIDLFAEGLEHINNHNDEIDRATSVYSRFLDILNPGRVVIRAFRQELSELFRTTEAIGKTTEAATRGAIYEEDAPMFGPELPPPPDTTRDRGGVGRREESDPAAAFAAAMGVSEEAFYAAQERAASEMAGMRMAQLEKEQALRDYELEQYQRDLDDRTKRYQTYVEGITALDEKKARERERIEQMVGPSIERTAATLANFEAKNAKERKELAKQTIADILAAEGRALIGKGVGNLIALNPIGAAQIAGGTAMVGAARAISGTVSGGGGGGGQATPRQNVQAGSQTIINPTVSFGFVGDRRAAYRDVEEANRRALERT